MKMLKRDVLAFGILFAFCCLLAAVDAEAVVTSYTPADVTIAYSQFAYDEKPCGNDTVNYAAVGTAVTPSLIFQGTCGNSSNSP